MRYKDVTIDKSTTIEMAEPPQPPVVWEPPDGGGGGDGAGTEPTLHCPFLDAPCIKDACMMWLDPKGSTISVLGTIQRCSLTIAGKALLSLAKAEGRKNRF